MDEKFSTRLKELRTELNLSQQSLAKAIGVTQKAIDFWEKDINEPKASYIIKLAKFFNVSTDYLLGLTKNKKRYYGLSILTESKVDYSM